MISICVTLKNRSRVKVGPRELLLFPNCVNSIVQATAGRQDVELVVSDWQSDDWPLEEWIEQWSAPVPVRIVTVSGEFSRGKGRNIAAKSAHGEHLFFLDADCLLSPETLDSGCRALSQGAAYFPVVFGYSSPESTEGTWHDPGYGNCFVTRSMFDLSGHWPEYGCWGREDPEFYRRIAEHVPIVRERAPGFIHQWHPNDVAWKDSFDQNARDARIAEIVSQEHRMQLEALKEIRETLAPNANAILVDQCEWDRDLFEMWNPLPFLERDGEYWGAPPDDTTAIRDLERLRREGATALVFAWQAFWWLDYYPEFRGHLGKYKQLAASDRVIVFDLQREDRCVGMPWLR